MDISVCSAKDHFTVYILYSDAAGKFYTGQCEDFEERLRRHNAGETISIRYGIPWRLIWKQDCASRSEAMLLERKIKSRGAKRYLSDLGIHL